MCICTNTKELKDLIIQHPELPIVFMCDYEICHDTDYRYWPADRLTARLGKILDCSEPPFEDRCWTDEDDKDNFKEEIFFFLDDKYDDKLQSGEMSREDFEQKLQEEIAHYNQYWKNCIIVYLGP